MKRILSILSTFLFALVLTTSCVKDMDINPQTIGYFDADSYSLDSVNFITSASFKMIVKEGDKYFYKKSGYTYSGMIGYPLYGKWLKYSYKYLQSDSTNMKDTTCTNCINVSKSDIISFDSDYVYFSTDDFAKYYYLDTEHAEVIVLSNSFDKFYLNYSDGKDENAKSQFSVNNDGTRMIGINFSFNKDTTLQSCSYYMKIPIPN